MPGHRRRGDNRGMSDCDLLFRISVAKKKNKGKWEVAMGPGLVFSFLQV